MLEKSKCPKSDYLLAHGHNLRAGQACLGGNQFFTLFLVHTSFLDTRHEKHRTEVYEGEITQQFLGAR
jgi:hypothetical protein